MPEEAIKLVRSPIDTHCGDPDCKKPIVFGAWTYYNPESMEAICPECGVKRGWSSKQRVMQLITALELREDVKALRKERKREADALFLLKKTVNLHRLGERDLELEQQILKLTNTVQDYLRHCGIAQEKEALQKVFAMIQETQELQQEVRETLHNRLFLIEKEETKLKTQIKIASDVSQEEAEAK